MGELERLRDAREFRVSRSHFTAAIAAAVLLSSVTFGIGFVLGRSRVSTEDPAAASLVDGVPSKSLVELLAEVDRVTLLHASQRMTYPEVLEGGAAPAVPAAAPEAPTVNVEIPASAPATSGQADPVPAGPFVVRVASRDNEPDAFALRQLLRASGHAAWASVHLQDGTPTWVVGVGSFATQADADAVAAVLVELVREHPDMVATPHSAPVSAL